MSFYAHILPSAIGIAWRFCSDRCTICPRVNLSLLGGATRVCTCLLTGHCIKSHVRPQYAISNSRRQSNIHLRTHEYTIICPLASEECKLPVFGPGSTDVVILCVCTIRLCWRPSPSCRWPMRLYCWQKETKEAKGTHRFLKLCLLYSELDRLLSI